MDSKFKVPRIPVVSANSLLQERTSSSGPNKKRSSKSSKKVLSQSAAAAALAAKKVVSKSALVQQQQQQLQPPSTDDHSKTEGKKANSQSFLPADVLPKLCPSCSLILVQYLSPIESYIRKLISHVDQIKTVAEIAQQTTTLSTFEFTTSTTDTTVVSGGQQSKSLSKAGKKSSSKHSAAAGGAKVPSSKTAVVSSKPPQHRSAFATNTSASATTVQGGKVVAPNAHTAGTTVATGGNHAEYSSQQQHFNNSNNGGNYSGGGHENVTINAVQGSSSYHGQANQSAANSSGGSVSHGSSDAHQHHHQQPQQQQVHQQHSQPPPFSGHQGNDGGGGGGSDGGSIVSSTNQFHHQQQQQQQHHQHQQQQHHQHQQQQHQEVASGSDHQPFVVMADHHNEIQNFSNDGHEYTATEEGKIPSVEKSVTGGQWTSEVEGSGDTSCPYAYVTLAYDNLSTVNAILLANSIQLFNNQVLNVLEDSDGLSTKRIVHQYHIPTVILLCDSNINRTLKQVVYQVFDKVIESKYQDAVLLNDESLGIQQYKIHLWKELAHQYEKCIFLESFTMVVGEISDLLLRAEELSASVDCFIPDHFNCSVFVFEPSMETYKNLLRLGLQLKLNEGNEDGEMGGGFDAADTLDEMTLLNQFFAQRWRKLSFVYNFVRNDLTYTQIPAYFKFGDNVRIVNFGSNAAAQHTGFGTAAGNASSMTPSSDNSNFFNSPLQPWNYKFDLAKATLEEAPFENAPVDNYCKFYLRCFVRRIWPLLSQTITPYLLSHHNGITEWTVFDLVQILGRQSGEGFAQNPVTLSRKKSWAIDIHLQQQLQQQLALEHQQEQEERKQQLSASEVEEDEDDQEASTIVADDDADQSSSVGGADGAESGDDLQLQQQQQQQSSEESKRQWEAGRVDWMGEHQSDRIISRLKHLIHQ